LWKKVVGDDDEKKGNLKGWLAWWLVVREELNVDRSWWLFIFNLCMVGGEFWKRRLLGSMLLLCGGNATIKRVGIVVVCVWWGVLILIPHFFSLHFWSPYPYFFSYLFVFQFFLKGNNNIDSMRRINQWFWNVRVNSWTRWKQNSGFWIILKRHWKCWK
jgi:hypothetical protein